MAFQLVTAMVNIGGSADRNTVVALEPPVTYPELLVIKYLHGENSVTDVIDVGDLKEERGNDEERNRLRGKYGDELVKELFPGALSRLPERGEFPTVEQVWAINAEVEAAKRRAIQSQKQPAPPAPAKPAKAAASALDDQLGDLGKGA